MKFFWNLIKRHGKSKVDSSLCHQDFSVYYKPIMSENNALNDGQLFIHNHVQSKALSNFKCAVNLSPDEVSKLIQSLKRGLHLGAMV
jgi:hypothetical protein